MVIGSVRGLRVESDRLVGATVASVCTVPVGAPAVSARVRSNAELIAEEIASATAARTAQATGSRAP